MHDGNCNAGNTSLLQQEAKTLIVVCQMRVSSSCDNKMKHTGSTLSMDETDDLQGRHRLTSTRGGREKF